MCKHSHTFLPSPSLSTPHPPPSLKPARTHTGIKFDPWSTQVTHVACSPVQTMGWLGYGTLILRDKRCTGREVGRVLAWFILSSSLSLLPSSPPPSLPPFLSSSLPLLLPPSPQTAEWGGGNTCEKCSVPFFWNVKDMWSQKTFGVRQVHCASCTGTYYEGLANQVACLHVHVNIHKSSH